MKAYVRVEVYLHYSRLGYRMELRIAALFNKDRYCRSAAHIELRAREYKETKPTNRPIKFQVSKSSSRCM
jgi:hypothetical protein